MTTTHKATTQRPTRKAPDGFLRWVVEFEVHPTWVADGFDLTDDRALDMLTNDLTYAYGHEVRARVLRAPDPQRVKNIQSGVEEVEEG